MLTNQVERVRSLSVRIATALSIAFAMVMGAPTPVLAQSADDKDGGLEEIVVTARKKEESLLDTPISISAFTSEDLDKKGITSFIELMDATPGINVTGLAIGGNRSDRSFQQITLRGFVPSSTLSVLTATFIDGVPVASPTAVASVHDPERVEILKGPQSAYFGRNTFAGAINVVNKRPSDEFGGSVSLTGGSRGNLDFLGSISGPLAGERFGYRLGGHYFSKDGSYNNPAQAGGRLGDQETRSISLLLTANPTENFSAKLFTLYSEDDDGPSAQGFASAYEIRANNGVVNYGTAPGTTIVPSLSNCSLTGFRFGDGRAIGPAATDNAIVTRPFICGAIPTGIRPVQNIVEDSFLARSIADPRHRVVSPSQGAKRFGLVREYRHAHLNLDYQFGESGFALSSLTGVNGEFWSEFADLDNYDSRLVANPQNPTGANTALLANYHFTFGVERETYDFSQEFRLAFDNEGPFSGLIGVSYLKTLVWNNLISVVGESVFANAMGVPNDRNLLSSAGKTPVETQSAFFGATYKFNEAWKLSVEGRYQSDEVEAFTTSNPFGTTVTAAAATQFGVPAGFYAPLTKITGAKYDNFLPRAILQYDINSDLMAYASYSKGVNVGVNTINTAFLAGSDPLNLAAAVSLGLKVVLEPERLTNYELGFKGSFMENRVQLQAAIYQATWSDQLNTRATTFPHPTLGTQLISGPANTGEVKLNGLEFDIVTKPTDHLELSLAAAMTDSSIQSFQSPVLSQLTGLIGNGYRGKELPQSSKYSMNLGVQYGTPISAWEDGSWFARADMSWKDKQYADQSNVTWIKARTLVNLRAGITKGKLAFDVYAENAFNDKNYTGLGNNPPILTPLPAPAANGASGALLLALPELRVVGARISYKF